VSHLIAAIHEAAVSKKALRTLVILGLYFSSTVLLDEAFRVRDGLTYFGIAGAGVSLLGAAWWKVAEWRRGEMNAHAPELDGSIIEGLGNHTEED